MTYHDLNVKMGESGRVRLKWPGIAALIYDFLRDEIHGARRSDKKLRVLPIPDELKGGWRVEDDFVASILGERPVTHTSFAIGVRYMQFTEAVARSSHHQIPVALPLNEFSNPSL